MGKEKESRFITNQGLKNLKERIGELIMVSKELKFLVGFFYFSGITELYESLKNRKDITIKVLVGLEVDNPTNRLIEHGNFDDRSADRDRIKAFFDSMKKSFTSEELDNSEFYQQASYFLKLIAEDRLIIRKTRNPNHSKLYIFKIMEGQDLIRNMLFITGSSNLTRAGLSGQGEFNVEICDYGCKEAEEFFDELWDDAIQITERAELKEHFIELISNETMMAPVTPFEAYALALKSYLDANAMKEINLISLKERMEKMGYIPYNYQMDAIKLALSIVNDYDGVIIADVVGLGKTIIACAVARLLRKRGIVICPPGLMGDKDTKEYGWYKHLEDFMLYDWEVYSTGKLEDALKMVRRYDEFEVVIIDEAHKYRNQDTESYELIRNICINKKVILLTATPFSNSPSDVFSLLKLFSVPGKSKLSLTDDLDFQFNSYNKIFKDLSHIQKYYNSKDLQKREKAITYYRQMFGSDNMDLKEVKKRTQYLANLIRSIIQPVLIRRNRIDLQNDPDYEKEVQDLSKLENPRELFYELTEEQSAFYDKVVSRYFGENGAFKGAIYRPYFYEEGRPFDEEEDFDENEAEGGKDKRQREQLAQKNLYDFMRRLLVKRFESSFGAFYQSVENFINIHNIILKFIQKSNKYILNRQLLEKIFELDPEEIEEELKKFVEEIEKMDKPDPRLHRIYDVNTFIFHNEFIADIKKDIELFNTIKREVERLQLLENDPKSQALAQKIPEVMKDIEKGEPQRKIIIFTEYKDTAEHLEKRLKLLLPPPLKNRILTIIGKLSDERYEKLLKNFDAKYEPALQANNYDILITTDRLSEGFNLNRAGAVINYDIPWNPTRVIQRVGRINRISKKVFNTLYIYNSFPTERGADFVKSREIAQHKMFLIHNTIGEDARIFDPDEEPSASRLYTKIMENPDKLEAENLYTTIKRKYNEIKKEYPQVIEKIQKLPVRVKTAKGYSHYNLLVFIKKGRSIFVNKIDDNSKKEEINFEDALKDVECKHDEPRLVLSERFWDNYMELLKTEQINISKGKKIWQEAKNNISYILNHLPPELNEYRNFIEILQKDICDYRTLSDYTLRRIQTLELDESNQYRTFKEVMDKLRWSLGENYLDKIKGEENITPEVIIAVENQPLVQVESE